ncbi:hypothetical protein ABIC86_005662 [Paenibacillus sp. DS2363]
MKRSVGPLCHGLGRVQFERCVSIGVNGRESGENTALQSRQ